MQLFQLVLEKNILHSLKWVHLLPDVCWYWHHFFGVCVCCCLILLVSVCVFVHVCWFYLDNVFWAAGPSEPYMVWWNIITIRGVMWKDWFAVFKVKVTAKASVIKMWLLMLWTANPFAANIVWWYMIIAGVSCEEIGLLFSRSEVWFVCLRSQSQQRVKNSSECSSKWYFLNCQTFCNQTYYSGASSWTEVPFKRSQWRCHINQPWLSTISYLLHFWPFGNQTVLWYISHTLPSEDLSPFLEGGCCSAWSLSRLRIVST